MARRKMQCKGKVSDRETKSFNPKPKVTAGTRANVPPGHRLFGYGISEKTDGEGSIKVLIEQELAIDDDLEIPATVLRFAAEGVARSKKVKGFGFVSSDSAHVWRVLSGLEPGRFCEWGSGMGIVAGMAHMLGHQAIGIELNEELVNASRQLLEEFGLDCQIHRASYFDLHIDADYYFVYCWPGQVNRVENWFETSTPPDAKLLICHGASDVRCKIRSADDLPENGG